jgi:hypothetical protein
VETFAEDGHLTSWKASWPPALPDEFSSMLAELFSPNPSQLARLTEQLWSMEEMKFAVAKLKQKNVVTILVWSRSWLNAFQTNFSLFNDVLFIGTRRVVHRPFHHAPKIIPCQDHK